MGICVFIALHICHCIRWDYASHEHNHPLIWRFLIYEEHSRCVLWTFWQTSIDYHSLSITSSYFVKRPLRNNCLSPMWISICKLSCSRVFMNKLKYSQKKRHNHPALFLSQERTTYKFKNTLWRFQIWCNFFLSQSLFAIKMSKNKIMETLKKFVEQLVTSYWEFFVREQNVHKTCWIHVLKCIGHLSACKLLNDSTYLPSDHSPTFNAHIHHVQDFNIFN